MKQRYIYNSFTLLRDGTTPLASFVFSEDDMDSMVSRFHQDLASGYANENVLQMCVTITLLQVTNNMGREKEVTPFIVKQDGFNRISFEPEETE